MNNIYNDISKRTNGDIYIGVVGPVRTGKSTFVTKFMDKLILPNIADKNVKARAVDELPQSADGKIIMTTQPKFVPNEAVKVTLGDKSQANVRLIDCVGYLVEGAEGHLENDKPRLVRTPWSNEDMPFEKAAEIGTQKVVAEHSTIAVVVTNDGTVTNLPRKNYLAAEERVIKELKAIDKPFVVVLNSKTPDSSETIALAEALSEKYDCVVLPMNVLEADKKDFEKVLQNILGEFSVRKMCINMPRWMRTLPKDYWLIDEIIEKVKDGCRSIHKMKQCSTLLRDFPETDSIFAPELDVMDMGRGEAVFKVTPKPELFYRVLSEQAKTDITDEYSLMSFVAGSSFTLNRYENLKDALNQAEEYGYGIVRPSKDSMKLEEPVIVKQGSRYGVRLTANASSLHIMRVNVETEVSPIVGTEQQSQYLLSEFQQNPSQIWDTNMFGKSLSSLVQEGLSEKCNAMPVEMQGKLVKTVGRIVNEGKGGLLCVLL
jgi:stage IV sporulation protein A